MSMYETFKKVVTFIFAENEMQQKWQSSKTSANAVLAVISFLDTNLKTYKFVSNKLSDIFIRMKPENKSE